jgi:hypothetical protein
MDSIETNTDEYNSYNDNDDLYENVSNDKSIQVAKILRSEILRSRRLELQILIRLQWKFYPVNIHCCF